MDIAVWDSVLVVVTAVLVTTGWAGLAFRLCAEKPADTEDRPRLKIQQTSQNVKMS